MKTNHTPGPWKANGGYVDAREKTVADVRAMSGMEVCMADACLIAAAPELLDALKRMLRLHYDEGTASLKGLETVSFAEEVIAKALAKSS